MKKPMSGSTALRPLILIGALTLLIGCESKVSDAVTAQRTLADRQACANALADGDIAPAQVACLLALERLAAGFGE